MSVEIIPVTLGFGTCYVLRAEGVIAIDAGAPHKGSAFLRGLERASIQSENVKLIILTHGHWDHIGSAQELKSITGAKLAMHQADAPCVEQSLTQLPPGITPWGRTFIAIHKLFLPLIRIPPAKVDILLGNEGLPLADYGIPGRVLHTPGHTAGSVSVLLDTGEAFVGDLAMNKFPLRLSPGLPIFAESLPAVVDSWKLLLKAGATTVYPAHGRRFPAEVMGHAIAA
jgi:hydroxyacylglutathione hydrolase